MTTDTALTTTVSGQALATDLDTAFADFLRLRVADGDASLATVHAYYGHVRAFVSWCAGPARAARPAGGEAMRRRRGLRYKGVGVPGWMGDLTGNVDNCIQLPTMLPIGNIPQNREPGPRACADDAQRAASFTLSRGIDA